MDSKMTNCKACGKEIAKGVNKCVHCGKDQRNFFMKHKIITIILALVILGAIGSMGGKKDESSKTASTKETTQSKSSEKKEDPVSKVGEVIKTDKFEIIINSIEEKTQVGNEYLNKSPSQGGTYVAVQYQYKNIIDKPVGSFSKPSINLTDKSGTKYNADIDATSTFATEIKLDSKIVSDLNPGITVKDAEVFEVSNDLYKQGGWKLLITADGKKVNININ